MTLRRLAPALALSLLAACGSVPVQVEHPLVTTQEGVVYQDVIEGLGPEVAPGRAVTIDYAAFLDDGTEVDSTHDRGTPVTFVAGEAPLAGWDPGLVGMRAGGRRILVVPPELAYGAEGVPGLVPPHAALRFEVELLRVLEAPEGEAVPANAPD